MHAIPLKLEQGLEKLFFSSVYA